MIENDLHIPSLSCAPTGICMIGIIVCRSICRQYNFGIARVLRGNGMSLTSPDSSACRIAVPWSQKGKLMCN